MPFLATKNHKIIFQDLSSDLVLKSLQWLSKVSAFTHKQWRGTWLCFSLILLSFGNKGWSFLFYWNVVPAWLPTVKKPRVFLTPCQRGETRGIVLSQEGMDLSQACPSASYFHTLEHLPSAEHDESAAMKGILLLRSHPHTSPFSQLQRHTPLPGERLFLKHSAVHGTQSWVSTKRYIGDVRLQSCRFNWINHTDHNESNTSTFAEEKNPDKRWQWEKNIA